MKKILFTLFFVTSVNFSYATDLKDNVQGVWLCTRIVGRNGNPEEGKFGGSDEYLKFTFTKSKLSITEAPYDRPVLSFNIKFIKNSFDLIPGSVYKIPEQRQNSH